MRRLASIALLAAAPACAAPADDWAWLTGDWLQCKGDEVVEEHWLGPRDGNLLLGANLTTARGRSTFEHLRIVEGDGTWTYWAAPNGRAPTPFRLAARGAESATFENPENRFPSRIAYRREGDALVARIEGVLKEQPAAMEWRFVRATAAGCRR